MNILIPMAGLGSRFPKDQYPLPKPLIDVNGRPMVVAALSSLSLQGKYLFVIPRNEHRDLLTNTIRSLLPDSVIHTVDHVTEGPACTAMLLSEHINSDQELVITNCDQIMHWDPEIFLGTARQYDGCVVTYHTDTPKNSYARIDRRGLVREIREKQVISNVSLNGIHYWKKGSDFVASARTMIRLQDRASNGEFYIGPTYNYMIEQGKKVGIHHIPNQQHHAVGVPEDLERYLRYEKSIN